MTEQERIQGLADEAVREFLADNPPPDTLEGGLIHETLLEEDEVARLINHASGSPQS